MAKSQSSWLREKCYVQEGRRDVTGGQDSFVRNRLVLTMEACATEGPKSLKKSEHLAYPLPKHWFI